MWLSRQGMTRWGGLEMQDEEVRGVSTIFPRAWQGSCTREGHICRELCVEQLSARQAVPSWSTVWHWQDRRWQWNWAPDEPTSPSWRPHSWQLVPWLASGNGHLHKTIARIAQTSTYSTGFYWKTFNSSSRNAVEGKDAWAQFWERVGWLSPSEAGDIWCHKQKAKSLKQMSSDAAWQVIWSVSENPTLHL